VHHRKRQAGLVPSVEPVDFSHADCLPIEPEHFTRRPEGQLAKSGVAVEKLHRPKFAKNKIALGCLTNDFRNFLDNLYPRNFGCLGGNWTVSTATGDCSSREFERFIAK
jgi:hypothetical protein